MKYISKGFRTIKYGAKVDGEVIKSLGAAAVVFAKWRANRRGNACTVSLDTDSPTSVSANGAVYSVIMLAPDGTVEDTEYLEVRLEH